MIPIPTRRQSMLSVVMGILFCIGSFFAFTISLNSGYRHSPDGTALITSFMVLLFGIIFISLGSRKVVDLDLLPTFLRTLIKMEIEEQSD